MSTIMTHSASYRRILHKMGYYNYQHGLIYRHLNQDNGWLSHEEHCRDFILKALDYYKPEKVTVLGSGWLLELPLSEMAERIKRICLIDIVHPPEVISQTAGMKNVKLTEQDLTGGLIEEVWKKAGRQTFLKKLSSIKEILIPEYEPVEDPGMVISLNLLTQLEILPEKFLRKKSKAAEEEFVNFRKGIQMKHILFLEKHKSIMITDVTEVFTRSDGTTFQNDTAAVEIPAGKSRDEWIWDFDLKKSDFNRKKSVFKVCAVIL